MIKTLQKTYFTFNKLSAGWLGFYFFGSLRRSVFCGALTNY